MRFFDTMKISTKLPQFSNNPTLLISISRQRAKFYFAEDGIIEKVREFSLDKPKYSDREGHFKQRGARGTYRSGAVYESKKGRVRDETANRFHENFRSVTGDYEFKNIYIFAPEHLKNIVSESVPQSSKEKIKMFHFGNYGNKHHHGLLDIIQEEIQNNSKNVKPLSHTALKLLKRRDN